MAVVQVGNGESIESALRRFKRRMQVEDTIRDAKRHAFFLKPGEKERVNRILRANVIARKFVVPARYSHDIASSDNK